MYQFLETIKLKDNGVPIFSHKKIEFISSRCLELYNSSLLDSPEETDIFDFIQYLKELDGLIYERRVLGKILNNVVLGLTDLNNNAIYIDPICETNPHLLRFTQAHEVGHWILHRHYAIKGYKLTNEPNVFKDTEDNMNIQKKLTTATDWIEWQANAFAAAILMPMQTFNIAVKNGIEHLEINAVTDHYQSIQMTPKDFHRLTLYLQNLYNVSQTSISYRLKQLENIKPTLNI